MKVKKIMVLCISVLLVCSFVLAGCTKPNDNEKNNGNGSTSAMYRQTDLKRQTEQEIMQRSRSYYLRVR